jgi:hypothetical protein
VFGSKQENLREMEH